MNPQHPDFTSNKNLPQKGKSNSTSITAAELTAAFRKTPAMVELAQMLDQVQNSPDWLLPHPVTVEVNKPLLTMLEFHEQIDAAQQGRAPTPIDKILSRVLDNVLQEELHWLVVAPTHFVRYRDLWNRFCDEQGAPQHKIAVPGETTEEEGREGPF